MDDQGEKIVFLARELLSSGFAEPPEKKNKLDITVSFKTLCLTTIIAAAAGGIATNALYAMERPLNRYEKTEIEALIFYTSKLKGISEDALRSEVAEKVGLPHSEDMTASDFPKARRLLQEKAQ